MHTGIIACQGAHVIDLTPHVSKNTTHALTHSLTYSLTHAHAVAVEEVARQEGWRTCAQGRIVVTHNDLAKHCQLINELGSEFCRCLLIATLFFAHFCGD
jgi:hypothetical protein